MILNNPGDQLFVLIGVFGGHQGADGKYPQGVGYGKGSFRRILSSGKGEGVRSPLALAVDIDPADLVDQRVNQMGDPVRVAAENTDLLAIV